LRFILKNAVKDCLNYLKKEEGIDIEEISWLEFKNWFESSWMSELVLNHTNEDIKKEFENQTKDPNQLKLPLEEKILNEDTDLKEFKRLFANQYGYISHSLTDKQISDFLNKDYIKNKSLGQQADLFQDYLLSQGLADDVMESTSAEESSQIYKKHLKIEDLKKEKSKLTLKALKTFPNSPKQLKIRERIDEINDEIKKMKEEID